jgi:hypothetical protein
MGSRTHSHVNHPNTATLTTQMITAPKYYSPKLSPPLRHIRICRTCLYLYLYQSTRSDNRSKGHSPRLRPRPPQQPRLYKQILASSVYMTDAYSLVTYILWMRIYFGYAYILDTHIFLTCIYLGRFVSRPTRNNYICMCVSGLWILVPSKVHHSHAPHSAPT